MPHDLNLSVSSKANRADNDAVPRELEESAEFLSLGALTI